MFIVFFNWHGVCACARENKMLHLIIETEREYDKFPSILKQKENPSAKSIEMSDAIAAEYAKHVKFYTYNTV